MITADTITDEQIRELRDSLLNEQSVLVAGDIERRVARANDIDACEMALFSIHTMEAWESPKAKARARCAEILNARGGK